jgi:hypothetical protein
VLSNLVGVLGILDMHQRWVLLSIVRQFDDGRCSQKLQIRTLRHDRQVATIACRAGSIGLFLPN